MAVAMERNMRSAVSVLLIKPPRRCVTVRHLWVS